MASVTKYAGGGSDDSSAGTQEWFFPEQATTNDGSTSFTDPPISGPEDTHYLRLTNFGFSIPTGSTIDGIVVEVYGRGRGWDGTFTNSNALANDVTAQLLAGGSMTGSNRASGGSLPIGSFDSWQYGSTVDKWGTTWSVSTVNGAGFGFALQVNFQGTSGDTAWFEVDWVRITVTYTPPPSGSDKGFFAFFRKLIDEAMQTPRRPLWQW